MKCRFTDVSVLCSDGDQFDGYVEWGLVLSVSDGGLAHVSGCLLIVTAVSWTCKWALCYLYGMLCLVSLFLSDEELLAENRFFFYVLFLFYMGHMNSGYTWVVALFVID